MMKTFGMGVVVVVVLVDGAVVVVDGCVNAVLWDRDCLMTFHHADGVLPTPWYDEELATMMTNIDDDDDADFDDDAFDQLL